MGRDEEIIQIALKHFANSNYDSCSLEAIAKELHITKPAIYYHFKNKNELYNSAFISCFGELQFIKYDSIESNLKEYINVYNNLFLAKPLCAKLFLKELACEFKHLNQKTILTLSNNLKFLTDTLKNVDVNPFYIQTLIMSSLTAYQNNLGMRKEISKIVNKEDSNFNIAQEIYNTILLYIKEKKL